MGFVPRRTDREAINLRIPKIILEDIDRLSNEYNLSRTEFILQCIEYSIENMEVQKNDKKGKDR